MSPAQTELNRSTVHEMTPIQNCSDRGRQAFIFHTKRQLGVYSRTVLQSEFDRTVISEEPDNSSHNPLESCPAFAAWSALNIGSQQQMWRALSDMVERQTDTLNQNALTIEARSTLGSLTLDANLSLPEYFRETAYHGQPGGFCLDRGDSDWFAGALQEAGGTLYTRGAGTGDKDSKGQAVVRFLSERFPEFQPENLIDLGCGHGGQTCNYAAAFPQARTVGVDLGAGLLRFGHLRAESLGIPLHLKQACASQTGFPDASFDLVVSNILLHEIPRDMLAAIMRESFRLLRPGGVVLHQDVPTQRPETPAFHQWLSHWQVQHNDEPFWQSFAETSVPDALVEAGFHPGQIFEEYVPQVDGPLVWYMVGAQKV